jgi:hypothetical protein
MKRSRKTKGAELAPSKEAQAKMNAFVEKLRAWRIRNVTREFNVDERRREREARILQAGEPRKK